MRLTEKYIDGYAYHIKRKDMDFHNDCLVGEFANKLGQLEDIEELCRKLETQRCYYVRYIDTNEFALYEFDDNECVRTAYDFKENKIYVFHDGPFDILSVAEYGTKWTLTKEELK